METDWTTHKLEGCLAALIDYRGKTPHKVDAGIPLVTAKIVKAGRIRAPTEFIAEADYTSWMTRGFPEPGDVVVTTEAPLGEVGQIKELPVALAQRIVTLRGKAGVLANSYLLYALQSEVMQARLRDRSSGTTVLGIKQSELRKVEIDLPPIEYQREIASILSCLDDRIDLLRQTNTTLEAIAQALFKSWFVDFDPVHAKAEGRESEAMDAATVALFPSEFEESELGLIPKGWRAGTLKDVCKIHDSKRVPLSGLAREKRRGSYRYYGAASVMDYIDDFIFDGVYVLLAEDGSVATKDGFALTQYVWGRIWVNNHAHVLEGAGGFSSEQLLLLLQRVRIHAYVTGAVQAKLSQRNMLTIPVVLPSSDISKAFDSLVSSLFARIRENTEAIDTLTQLRDTLLPRLISGKLRLPDTTTEMD